MLFTILAFVPPSSTISQSTSVYCCLVDFETALKGRLIPFLHSPENSILTSELDIVLSNFLSFSVYVVVFDDVPPPAEFVDEVPTSVVPTDTTCFPDACIVLAGICCTGVVVFVLGVVVLGVLVLGTFVVVFCGETCIVIRFTKSTPSPKPSFTTADTVNVPEAFVPNVNLFVVLFNTPIFPDGIILILPGVVVAIGEPFSTLHFTVLFVAFSGNTFTPVCTETPFTDVILSAKSNIVCLLLSLVTA